MATPNSNAGQPPQQMGDYQFFETIGKGSFGKVKRGVHIPTGERVAVKILNRQKLKSANMDKKIKREINILKLFRHPNICRLYDVVQTPEDIFIIMEYVDGGELYDYIVKMGQLKEDAARYVFQQIICAIEYCHHFRVVHRDLKPENILLGPNLQVKIIDFGLANLMRDGDFLATSCGSPNYAAPEVISGRLYCGPEVDVWSAGVVLYALLCGCLPFDEDSIPQLFAKIKKGRYEVPPHLSPGARGLLAQLLTVDPLHRATIPQIRDNYWFNERLPAHMVFNEEIYMEGERVHATIVRAVAQSFQLSEKDVRSVVEVTKAGRAYVAYCILADVQRRRELNQCGHAVLASCGGGGGAEAGGGSGSAGASSNSTSTGDFPRQGSIASSGGNTTTTNNNNNNNSTSSTSRTTAAQRELNLGLILSINPAMEAMLDGGDATMNKDLYNNSLFLPVSNRSITSVGTPNLTRNSSQLSSSHVGGGAGGGGLFGGGGGGGGGGANSDTGAGFSLTRRATATLGGGNGGNGGGGGLVGSLLNREMGYEGGGGGGSGSGTVVGGGSVRTLTSTLARFSPQTRPTPPTSAVENPRVGSVARTTLVYSAAEAEVALASNAGWRVGIMTNKPSNMIMAEVYEVLAELDMCWKVLSPFRVAAKFNDPPRNSLGARRQRMIKEVSLLNAEATSGAGASSSPPHHHHRHHSATAPTGGHQHQLLSSSSSSAVAAAAVSVAGSGAATSSSSSVGGVVGAAVSCHSPIILLHLFRLQEKHDKGYIMDLGIRGGKGSQLMIGMDLIVEIFDSLRRRIG